MSTKNTFCALIFLLSSLILAAQHTKDHNILFGTQYNSSLNQGANQSNTEQQLIEAQANYRLALSHFTHNQIDSTVFYATKIIDNKKGNELYLKSAYNLLSECYLLKQDYKNAYLFKSEELFLSEKKEETSVSSFSNDLFFLNEMEKLKANNDFLLNNQKKYSYLFFSLLILGFITFYYFSINYKRKKFDAVLEKEITKHTKELERKNKTLKQSLEELERFNHILSHDLKEPFRNIISFSDLSIRDLNKNKVENLTEYLGFISTNSKQMYNLIEKTKDFTNVKKAESIDIYRIDLNELMKKIKNKLQLNSEHNHKILLFHKLPIIQENRELLEQMLTNLIHNGWTYNNNISPTVVVAYHSYNNHHILTVRDNGIGIDKEYHEEVFKMYVRLESRGKNHSAGMGLSISQKIARELGGEIVIAHSSKQEGTALEVRLPIKKAVGYAAVN